MESESESELEVVKSALRMCIDEEEVAQTAEEEAVANDTVSEGNTEWLSEELTVLRTVQKKLDTKFKRDSFSDSMLTCSESNSTQVQVDEFYNNLLTDTLSFVGSQYSRKILNIMQKAYDKELIEESNSIEDDLGVDIDFKPKKKQRNVKMKRDCKAERK